MNEPNEDRLAHEVTLMRFAAGELSTAAENAVLLDCEVDPAGWRDIALAMVEHRRLERGLAALSDGVTPAPAAPTTARRHAIAGWLALAACLGLAIGYGVRQPAAAPATDELIAATTPVSRSWTDDYLVLDETVTAELVTAYRPVFDAAAREEIRRHGYRIEEQPRLYFVMDDSGGTPIAVPSRNIRFHYVGE